MALLQVQHILHGKSELPEDQFVNTFYFWGDTTGGNTPPADAAQAANLVSVVQQFYTGTTNPVGESLMGYLAQTVLAPNPHHFKVYNLSAPKPRYPLLDVRATGQPALLTTFKAIPHEIAACLSYRGAALPDTVAARRRGRVYVGPLNEAGTTISADGSCRPLPALNACLRAAGHRVRQAASAVNWKWVVFSRKAIENDSSLLAGVTTITEVSTDDAFDTQRRRGLAPTARVSLTVV